MTYTQELDDDCSFALTLVRASKNTNGLNGGSILEGNYPVYHCTPGPKISHLNGGPYRPIECALGAGQMT